MRAIISLLTTALLLAGCQSKNKKSGASSQAALQPRTGFFVPLADDEYRMAPGAVSSLPDPITMAAELDVKIERQAGDELYVARSRFGDVVLFVQGASEPGRPIYSKSGKGYRYAWTEVTGALALAQFGIGSRLFIRHTLGTEARPFVSEDGSISNLHVMHYPRSVTGTVSPVLVPWLDHVATGSGEVLYRAGTRIFDALTDLPILALEPKAPGVWLTLGTFRDGDLGFGTVFFASEDGTYVSVTPGERRMARWERQNDQSLALIGSVAAAEVTIPAAAEVVLASVADIPPQEGLSPSSGLGLRPDRTVLEMLLGRGLLPRAADASEAGLSLADVPPRLQSLVPLAPGSGHTIPLARSNHATHGQVLNDARVIASASYKFGARSIVDNAARTVNSLPQDPSFNGSLTLVETRDGRRMVIDRKESTFDPNGFPRETISEFKSAAEMKNYVDFVKNQMSAQAAAARQAQAASELKAGLADLQRAMQFRDDAIKGLAEAAVKKIASDKLSSDKALDGALSSAAGSMAGNALQQVVNKLEAQDASYTQQDLEKALTELSKDQLKEVAKAVGQDYANNTLAALDAIEKARAAGGRDEDYIVRGVTEVGGEFANKAGIGFEKSALQAIAAQWYAGKSWTHAQNALAAVSAQASLASQALKDFVNAAEIDLADQRAAEIMARDGAVVYPGTDIVVTDPKHASYIAEHGDIPPDALGALLGDQDLDPDPFTRKGTESMGVPELEHVLDRADLAEMYREITGEDALIHGLDEPEVEQGEEAPADESTATETATDEESTDTGTEEGDEEDTDSPAVDVAETPGETPDDVEKMALVVVCLAEITAPLHRDFCEIYQKDAFDKVEVVTIGREAFENAGGIALVLAPVFARLDGYGKAVIVSSHGIHWHPTSHDEGPDAHAVVHGDIDLSRKEQLAPADRAVFDAIAGTDPCLQTWPKPLLEKLGIKTRLTRDVLGEIARAAKGERLGVVVDACHAGLALFDGRAPGIASLMTTSLAEVAGDGNFANTLQQLYDEIDAKAPVVERDGDAKRVTFGEFFDRATGSTHSHSFGLLGRDATMFLPRSVVAVEAQVADALKDKLTASDTVVIESETPEGIRCKLRVVDGSLVPIDAKTCEERAALDSDVVLKYSVELAAPELEDADIWWDCSATASRTRFSGELVDGNPITRRTSHKPGDMTRCRLRIEPAPVLVELATERCQARVTYVEHRERAEETTTVVVRGGELRVKRGTSMTLTSVPDEDTEHDAWSGDIDGASPSASTLTLAMDRDRNIRLACEGEEDEGEEPHECPQPIIESGEGSCGVQTDRLVGWTSTGSGDPISICDSFDSSGLCTVNSEPLLTLNQPVYSYGPSLEYTTYSYGIIVGNDADTRLICQGTFTTSQVMDCH